MTEEEARQWVRAHWGVSRETQVARFAEMVRDESVGQNLVSRSSLDFLWSRHIADSAQLIALAEAQPGSWLDIGSGAGFPGLVIALLTDRRVILCEPRRKRAAFLGDVVEKFGLGARVSVEARKVEALTERVSIISARAVAALPVLFEAAAGVSDSGTLWVLPKGRAAREEVAVARKTWHGSFHVEQSITQPDSLIVVARGVARR